MRAISLLLLALLGAAVAGCQESGFNEATETEKPLKVQHAKGESKVPGRAERPVAFTADALDDTLALGLRPPLAVLPGGRLPAYLRPRARGLKVLGPPLPPSLEPIRAADPDVILASVPAQVALYDRLRRIAPTVMDDAGDVGWKLNARLHGEALGRTNDAERLLIEYDRRSGQVRESLGARARGTKVAVVRVGPAAVRVAAEQSFPGSVIGDLGRAAGRGGRGRGQGVPQLQLRPAARPRRRRRAAVGRARRGGPRAGARGPAHPGAGPVWCESKRARGGPAAASSQPARRCAT